MSGDRSVQKRRKQKLLQKFCDHGANIFFFRWEKRDWDRCQQVDVLMCTIAAMSVESYTPGLFHLQEPLKMP